MNIKQESKERRARNRAAGMAALRSLGNVTIHSKNRGVHLVVTTSSGTKFDYWPGTGLWRQQGHQINDQLRGIRSFLDRLKQEETKK